MAAYADRRAVMQIITNLLQNAISYTPSGGTVEVYVSPCEGRGKIVVADTGIGIADEERELIFGEFHRTERARRLQADGNGLGLSIVKRLVEEMRGKVWVNSDGEGKGSTFTVLLPGDESTRRREGI